MASSKALETDTHPGMGVGAANILSRLLWLVGKILFGVFFRDRQTSREKRNLLPARFALRHVQVPVEVEVEHLQPCHGSLSERLFVGLLRDGDRLAVAPPAAR